MDVQQYLNTHRVPNKAPGTHHHVRSGWVGTDCPKCSPNSGRWRLGFELATGRCNCWTCGIQDGAATLAKLCRTHISDVLSWWRGGRNYQAPTQSVASGTLKLPTSVGAMLPAHRHYLQSRGFDPGSLEQLWGVQGIGPGHPLQWRLYIPIHDALGTVVSWTTRRIGDGGLRYRSAGLGEETIHHKYLLYGAHLARQAVVVVEGPADAWAVGPGAVATLGVAYSRPQALELAARYPVRVVCFDASSDAQQRASELCKWLAPLPGVTERVELETGPDPGEADPAELVELRRTYLEF